MRMTTGVSVRGLQAYRDFAIVAGYPDGEVFRRALQLALEGAIRAVELVAEEFGVVEAEVVFCGRSNL